MVVVVVVVVVAVANAVAVAVTHCGCCAEVALFSHESRAILYILHGIQVH